MIPCKQTADRISWAGEEYSRRWTTFQVGGKSIDTLRLVESAPLNGINWRGGVDVAHTVVRRLDLFVVAR